MLFEDAGLSTMLLSCMFLSVMPFLPEASFSYLAADLSEHFSSFVCF
jgi:hypothetical protein